MHLLAVFIVPVSIGDVYGAPLLVPRVGPDGYPTTEEIQQDYKPPPRDKSLFWSGLKGFGNVLLEYERANTDLRQLKKSFPDNYLRERTPNELDHHAFVDRVSKVYAEGVSGKVRVLYGEPSSRSVWERVELPALKVNPQVEQIILVDPKTKREALLWEPC